MLRRWKLGDEAARRLDMSPLCGLKILSLLADFAYGRWEVEYGIWDMEYGIGDMEYGIWDRGYGIWNMGYGIWDTSLAQIKSLRRPKARKGGRS